MLEGLAADLELMLMLETEFVLMIKRLISKFWPMLELLEGQFGQLDIISEINAIVLEA